MRQRIKNIVLMVIMAFCFFALSACAAEKTQEEPVPDMISQQMLDGAEQYLMMFEASSEEDLEQGLAEVRKMKDPVMEAAIQSWMSSKKDLGGFKEIISREIERNGEGYKATLNAEFEKRNLTFSLSAEEVYQNGSATLTPTEIIIAPAYTTGEKLAKAGLNTLMGMGTVFLVLIFISLLIAQFKKINALEKKIRENKAAKEAAAREAAAAAKAKAAPAPAPAPVPAPAPAPAPVPEPVVEEPAVDELELVAVITAAISAATGVPADELVVRSIRRRTSRRVRRA